MLTIEQKIRTIQTATALEYGVTRQAIVGKKRSSVRVTKARQISMYLCRVLTDATLEEVGEHHGGRHHTTALYGLRHIGEQREGRTVEANQLRHRMRLIQDRATVAWDQEGGPPDGPSE